MSTEEGFEIVNLITAETLFTHNHEKFSGYNILDIKTNGWVYIVEWEDNYSDDEKHVHMIIDFR
jgi:hypothetical protein